MKLRVCRGRMATLRWQPEFRLDASSRDGIHSRERGFMASILSGVRLEAGWRIRGLRLCPRFHPDGWNRVAKAGAHWSGW